MSRLFTMEPVHYHYGKFPPTNIEWEKLIPLIGPANAALARYDGTLSAIPNALVLLSPLTTQEAVLSSRIEGTQATMGEVLEFEAEGDANNISNEKREDIHEILNYRRAMMHAIELLNELPLCQRVVREAHHILLEGVRGQGKSPGEYRQNQNWIGTHGCTIEEARFVPISAERISDGISDWEKYIHEEMPEMQLPAYTQDDYRGILEMICYGATRYKEVKERSVWPTLESWFGAGVLPVRLAPFGIK